MWATPANVVLALDVVRAWGLRSSSVNGGGHERARTGMHVSSTSRCLGARAQASMPLRIPPRAVRAEGAHLSRKIATAKLTPCSQKTLPHVDDTSSHASCAPEQVPGLDRQAARSSLMDLRQYQRDSSRRFASGAGDAASSSTGGDKTIVMSEIIRHAENQHVLVLVHPWNNPEPPTPEVAAYDRYCRIRFAKAMHEGGGEWLGSGSARAKAGSNIVENS